MTSPADESVDMLRDLIRFESVNDGTGRGKGEREAAEYVAGKLAEVGLEPQVFEAAANRTSVVARVEGEDPSRDALLIHCHLDVVPAQPKDWTYDPFAAEIADGCVWGRGAVDMLDMNAMTLAVMRDRLRTGRKPPRDVVLAFVADEEAGGVFGAQWLVDNQPGLFDGCTEAISEVGGFNINVNEDLRLYLIETAQKGMAWMRLTAAGTAGHGSMINEDNAVTKLAEAVARLGNHEFPIHVTKTVRAFLEQHQRGVRHRARPRRHAGHGRQARARWRGSSARRCATRRSRPCSTRATSTTSSPAPRTRWSTGASCLGWATSSSRSSTRCSGPTSPASTSTTTSPWRPSSRAPWSTPCATPSRRRTRGRRQCPTRCPVAPMPRASAGSACAASGSHPLKLPIGLDFAGMFHGVDERVPLDALAFGTRVLDRFLDAS